MQTTKQPCGGSSLEVTSRRAEDYTVTFNSIHKVMDQCHLDSYQQQQQQQPPKQVQDTGKPTKLQVDKYWQVIRQEAIAVVTSEASKNESTKSQTEEQQLELQLDEETQFGITQRPSGAWQAQIYYAGKTRYIGCFENKMTAARVYQLLREKLKVKIGKRGKSGSTLKKNTSTDRESSIDGKNQSNSPPTNSETGTGLTRLRSSSNCSMPPLKKRRIQEKVDLTSNPKARAREFTAKESACANGIVAVDNAYQQPTGAVPLTRPPFRAFNAPSVGQLTAGQYIYGGVRYAPLIPPTQSQHSIQHHHHLVQIMPPPPPPFVAHFAPAIGGVFPASLSFPVLMVPFHPNVGFPQQTSEHPDQPNNLDTRVARAHFNTKVQQNRVYVSSTSDPVKNAENDKKWKDVRKEVLDHVKSGDADGATVVTMDKEMLRGITQRPSGKYQAQMYFAGQSRYIGVFDSKEKAAVAYEMIRTRIKPLSLSGQSVFSSSKRDGAAIAASSSQDDQLPVAAVNKNNRAITPSPTTVGAKYGRPMLSSKTPVMAAPTRRLITRTGIVSPLSHNKLAASSAQQAACIQLRKKSMGHFVPPPC
jgi:hypothetical protein